MDINNYSDLSNFVFSEYEKLQDFGVSKPPAYVLKAMDKACIRYMKLYSKPLYRKQKAKLKLQEALDTMPHGFIWRLLHPKLWAQVQAELSKQQQEQKQQNQPQSPQQPKTVYPELYKPIDVPQIAHIENDTLERVKE